MHTRGLRFTLPEGRECATMSRQVMLKSQADARVWQKPYKYAERSCAPYLGRAVVVLFGKENVAQMRST